MKKLALSFGALALACASITPALACEGSKTAAAAEAKPVNTAGLAKAEFTVDGMSCAVSCPAQIKTALAAVKGVSSVDVNFDTKTVTVGYAAKDVSAKTLLETINKLGYKAIEKNAAET